MKKIAGGVTTPKGFKAAGAHVGLKRKKKDLAILVSDVPAKVAAVFTTNVVKAAPILWNQDVIKSGQAVSAIVINSGNANACTGKIGIVHTKQMAETVAAALGLACGAVMVASTGVIGVTLPIEKIQNGIGQVAALIHADSESGTNAAEAIMTTDSFFKQIAVQVELGGKIVTIGGMAKGSGMIHPNMATMLGFITTDANITQDLLHKAFKKSILMSYNMISVDGDTSTNDMAVVLANGLAGNSLIESEDADYIKFADALHEVNCHLAKTIAQDGEGATKFLEVTVKGTHTQEDAQKLSKAVVSSSLVKTAFFGGDANWGRILAALGYGGVLFDPENVSINFANKSGSLSLMSAGEPVKFDEAEAAMMLAEKDIQVLIDMHQGNSVATAWGCDLSYDYVRINGAYRT